MKRTLPTNPSNEQTEPFQKKLCFVKPKPSITDLKPLPDLDLISTSTSTFYDLARPVLKKKSITSDEKSYTSKLRSHQSKHDHSYENHALYYSDTNVLHEIETEEADPFSVLDQTSQIIPTMVKMIISPDEEDHRNLERYSPDNLQLPSQPHGKIEQMDATIASLLQLMQQQLQLTQQ